jgi:hypothetical protein
VYYSVVAVRCHLVELQFDVAAYMAQCAFWQI